MSTRQSDGQLDGLVVPDPEFEIDQPNTESAGATGQDDGPPGDSDPAIETTYVAIEGLPPSWLHENERDELEREIGELLVKRGLGYDNIRITDSRVTAVIEYAEDE